PKLTFEMVHNFIKAQNPKNKAEFKSLAWEQRLGYFPLGTLYYLAWHGWLAYHAVALSADALGSPLVLSASTQSFVNGFNFVAVVLMLPSFLRTFSLHFISSNMHYFGDIEDKNTMQQTQVLNPWWLMPFQLFCFNFGSTHAIHHFAVKEPFYVRQWTAPTAHKIMREMGVRFNDFGSFRRANRFNKVPVTQATTRSASAA
ncbi:MAG: hypothetical protein ACSHWQ_05935, partial [Spongiibacteraceae bacterium]